MSRPLVVTSRAQQHIATAAQWYQSQVPSLGLRFLEALDRRLASITRFPEAWPVVYREHRRALLKPFPFGVFYRVEPDTLVLTGVLDLRRDPV